MNMKVVILLVGVLYTIHAAAINGTDTCTLVLAHVVFRHGDRTPDSDFTFATDEYADETYFPYGKGQLTKPGKIRSFNLGKAIRDRYTDFLGDLYYPDLIEAISSGLRRCRMTMELVLASLFPPNPSEKIADGLNWQPISYDYTDIYEDMLIATYKSCPEIPKAPAASMDDTTRAVFLYLTKFAGEPVTSSFKVFAIEDIINTQSDYGLPKPKWVLPIWPQPIKDVGQLAFANMIADKKRLSSAGGKLIQKIAADSINKASGDLTLAQRKLYLYSGHDYNINILLGILGCYNGVIIKYSAHLYFEVHLIDNEYYMKVFLENFDGPSPQLLKIPGCGELCPLWKFYALTKQYYPTEWCKF